MPRKFRLCTPQATCPSSSAVRRGSSLGVFCEGLKYQKRGW